MGPTKVYKTKYEAPHTIRGMFGLTDTRNSTHGSGKINIRLYCTSLFTAYLFIICVLIGIINTKKVNMLIKISLLVKNKKIATSL